MKQLKKFLSKFPTKLPVGLTEFEAWTDDIIELSGELANRDSIQFVLSDMIQRTGALKNSAFGTIPGYVPKDHFVQGLIAAAAKQVAGQVFFDIKTKQQEAAKAAQAAVTVNEEKASQNNGTTESAETRQ